MSAPIAMSLGSHCFGFPHHSSLGVSFRYQSQCTPPDLASIGNIKSGLRDLRSISQLLDHCPRPVDGSGLGFNRHRRDQPIPLALQLLDEFVAWGKKNADWITFGVMTDTPVKDAALLKRGFVYREKAFLMEVE